MKYIVLKFGGSSITEDGFKTIINEIHKNKDNKIIIVLSAIKDITNLLYKCIEENNLENYKKIKTIHEPLIELLTDTDKVYVRSILTELYTTLFGIINYNKKENIVRAISYGEKLSTIIFHKYLDTLKIKSQLINAYTFIKIKLNGSKQIFSCDKDIG